MNRTKFFYKELKNPQNHCYLNSVLQVVCSRPIFANRVLRAYQIIVHYSKSSLTEIFRVLKDVCKQLPLSPSQASKLRVERYDVEDLDKLIFYLGENYCEQLLENNGQNQQDAQEFYGCLIDALDDQCEGRRPKKLVKKLSNSLDNENGVLFTPMGSVGYGDPNLESTRRDSMHDGFNQNRADVLFDSLQGNEDKITKNSSAHFGDRSYKTPMKSSTNSQDYEKRESTGALILPSDLNPARLLRVPLIYTRACNSCSNPTKITDKSNLLSISLDCGEETDIIINEEIPTIQFLLDKFFAEEQIEVTCEICGGKTAANKVRIESPPIYLMILVMRYSHTNGVPERLGHKINIDEKISVEAYMNEVNESRKSILTRQEPEIIELDETLETDCFAQAAEPTNRNVRTQGSDDLFDNDSTNSNNKEAGEGITSDSSLQNGDTREPFIKKARRDDLIDAYCDDKSDVHRNEWLHRTWRHLTPQQNASLSSGVYTFRPPPISFSKAMQKTFRLDRVHNPVTLGALRRFTKDDLNTKNHAIEADGNCLFRALSWWITGSEVQYRQIRTMICAFLRAYPAQFSPLLQENENFDEHVNMMSHDGTWGTQVELLAAAELFTITIFTLHHGSWKVFRPRFFWSQEDLCKTKKLHGHTHHAIYLSNAEGYHFDVVLDVMPDSEASRTYNLVGVVNHSGRSLLGGHYTALVNQSFEDDSLEKGETWLLCDDSRITDFCNLEEALRSSDAMSKAYLLLYRRQDVTAEIEGRELFHMFNNNRRENA